MGWSFKKSEAASKPAAKAASKPAAKAAKKPSRDWGVLRDAHAAKASDAAARGDMAKAHYHQGQQAAAVQNAQAEGMWWIKA